jgi:hypothetical protein
MNPRSLSMIALITAALCATGALAHDPSLHAPPVTKAKPTTCAQLADTQRYSAELADKALKLKCDAEAKAARKEQDEKAKTDQGE